jgi:hypothetical protein
MLGRWRNLVALLIAAARHSPRWYNGSTLGELFTWRYGFESHLRHVFYDSSMVF